MADAVELMQRPFLRRIREPYAWGRVAYVMPRLLLAALLALAPLVLVLLAAWLGPAELRKAIVEPKNVQETFARFVSAVATASAIAVSVATLTLGRELKGIQRQQERAKASEDFRDRVRRASGRESIPLSLGPFMAVAFESLREAARRARRVATREELSRAQERVPLGQFLDVMEASAERTRVRMLSNTTHPHALARHALDFEEELSSHLARRFARLDRLGPQLQGALEDLEERMADVITGVKYLKTLDIQWGLSRMSVAITVTTLPSILVAAAWRSRTARASRTPSASGARPLSWASRSRRACFRSPVS